MDAKNILKELDICRNELIALRLKFLKLPKSQSYYEFHNRINQAIDLVRKMEMKILRKS